MKPLFALLFLISSLASLASKTSPSKDITFIGQDFEPFYFKSGSHGVQGAYYEISQELCRLQKRHCKFKITGFRESLNFIQTGKADFTGPLAFTKPRTLLYHYSIPLFSTAYCFYSLPNNFKETLEYKHLENIEVCVYGPSANQLSLLRINEAVNNKIKIALEPDVHTCFRKVESNVYPFTYANCDTGRYWIEHTKSHLK